MTIAEKQEKIREHIKQLIADKGINMAEISRMAGKAHSHLFQYITKKTPKRLDEVTRKILARALEVNEQELTDLPLSELTSTIPVKPIYKVGYVQAGKFNEACQLPESEWESVPYPINENYKNARIFALGVRGDSMNLTFPPEKTTLICCPLEDWIEINPETSLEGKYIIAYRRSPDGTCEATVKKYTRIDETTVILVAESSNPNIKPIILHPDSNEYEIAAVVVGDLRIY